MSGAISFRRAVGGVALALILVVCTTQSAPAGTILWDTNHGITTGCNPGVDYTTLASRLTGWGHTLTVSNAGVIAAGLSNYDALIINAGTSWNSAYTVAEVNAITAFVNGGGGLVIMSDGTGFPTANIAPVGTAFGFNINAYQVPGGITTNNFATHDIFTDVSAIQLNGVGLITATAPSLIVAWRMAPYTGHSLVGVRVYGDGNVVAIGDTAVWHNALIDSSANSKFAENVFDFLGPPPITLVPSADALGPYECSPSVDLTLDGSESFDPDGGNIVTWLWDMDNDGEYDDASGPILVYTKDALETLFGLGLGDHTIGLMVYDDEGESGMDSAMLSITPEPATMALLALGGLSIVLRRRAK